MADPYQWRESVLSTRSLSYVSNMDAAEAMLRPSTLRKNTLSSITSSYADEDFQDALTQVPSPQRRTFLVYGEHFLFKHTPLPSLW